MAQESPLQKQLISLGLQARMAMVYLAILEMGQGTVTEITRKAGINRTTGYSILDNLVAREMISVSGKKPKQQYTAEDPEKILKLLQDEVARGQEHMSIAQKLVPELKSIYQKGARPRVIFHEGTEGMEEVYEDTLTSRESIRAFASIEDMHGALPHYFPQYYKRRAGKGISIRAIIPANPAGMERASQDKDESRETALVPADKFHFSPEINIYDNKVMIASWREKLGIIIESQEIAEAMKEIYELAWAEAKRLDMDIKNKTISQV